VPVIVVCSTCYPAFRSFPAHQDPPTTILTVGISSSSSEELRRRPGEAELGWFRGRRSGRAREEELGRNRGPGKAKLGRRRGEEVERCQEEEEVRRHHCLHGRRSWRGGGLT
jgi:hypothetical protein